MQSQACLLLFSNLQWLENIFPTCSGWEIFFFDYTSWGFSKGMRLKGHCNFYFLQCKKVPPDASCGKKCRRKNCQGKIGIASYSSPWAALGLENCNPLFKTFFHALGYFLYCGRRRSCEELPFQLAATGRYFSNLQLLGNIHRLKVLQKTSWELKFISPYLF